jgi:pimeloyl-ACP methyl ester carboxylesterase
MARVPRSTKALAFVVVLASGCSGATGVEISRSGQRKDAPAPSDETAPERPHDSTSGGQRLPAIEPVVWTECQDQPAPWQCGTIRVPLDYDEPDGRKIFVALTRLPAANPDVRIGSFVVNPGGPGGSGLALAYGESAELPTAILDRFDVVGFDPRGVGRSTAAHCPDDVELLYDQYDQCVDSSRGLLPYIGTANTARDLEEIRRALGDEGLTYLGYSYGTAIGAVYADMFPTHVRALVLDGAVDPGAGHANESGEFSDNYYAEQDFPRTIDVWHRMCDATPRCAAGPESRALLARVQDAVRDLPTSYFDDSGELTRGDVDSIVVDSMYDMSDWAALSVALKDADDGDASTLAALYSWLLHGYPIKRDWNIDAEFGYFGVLCADFSARGHGLPECGAFPESAEALPEIVEVDTATPVLVVGTHDDPATPARYARLMAHALGDAVSIEWQGAGHTAFLASGCVTAMVTRYLVDLEVPSDDVRCPFLPGANTLIQRADVVFGAFDFSHDVDLITSVLVATGWSASEAGCIAKQLVRRGDRRLIVHQALGVESPDLIDARRVIEHGCSVGG